jgi:hypothetical protein
MEGIFITAGNRFDILPIFAADEFHMRWAQTARSSLRPQKNSIPTNISYQTQPMLHLFMAFYFILSH